MGLFDNGKVKALQREISVLQRNVNASLFSQINRNIAIYPDGDVFSNANRYVTTDDIYSIIRRLATACAMIPVYGYEVKPDAKKIYKQLKKIKQQHQRLHEVKTLQRKALEDLPDNDRVNDLIENPCEGKGKFEFYEAVYSFLFIQGEAIIYKVRAEQGVNKGLPVSLKVLYPQNMICLVSDTLPREIVGWDYVVNGQKIYENIPVEDIIHIRYFNPEMDYMGGELRGLSPLKVLTKRFARIDANTNASVSQLQNGGIETIVWDKNSEAGSGVAQQRKDNFYKFISNSNNSRSPFFADGDMGALHLGSTLVDMQVLELAKIDFKKLCNAYSVSDRLFNNDATGSEISDKGARKGLYTDACLPNVYRVLDCLKVGLLDEFEKGIKFTEINENGELDVITIQGDGKVRDLQADLSEIAELQADMKDMATWLNTAWWITPNDKLDMMNFERNPDPLFDEPFIPSGLITAGEMSVPPIPGDTIN